MQLAGFLPARCGIFVGILNKFCFRWRYEMGTCVAEGHVKEGLYNIRTHFEVFIPILQEVFVFV